jgi:hypothetical protein
MRIGGAVPGTLKEPNHSKRRDRRLFPGKGMIQRFKSAVKSVTARHIAIGLYLCLYLTMAVYTELAFVQHKPISTTLLEDFTYYQRALDDALNGKDPYAIRFIGTAFLYPPQSLFIIELFNRVKPFFLRAAFYLTLNITLLALIVYGTASYYGYSSRQIWHWYVICLGFAPFLELLHIGQINVITLFGIFILFILADTAPILGGMGLTLAIITKVSPIMFLGYLVVNKKYKIITAVIVFLAITTCLTVLRYGVSPVIEYPNVFAWLTNQFPLEQNSQSLVAKLHIIKRFLLFQRVLMAYILLTIAVSGLFTLYGNQPKEPLFIITGLGMTLAPNVMWYHHYVFMLLPLLIWMGWRKLDDRVVAWCLAGLLIVQIDRTCLTNGLLIHVFGHISLLSVLIWQARHFVIGEKTAPAG